jgi:putative sigma-54 modulation protein
MKMDIKVSGRKMPVTDALREYAEDKIGGAIEQLDVGAISCDIVLYVEKNPANPNRAVCEVTVIIKSHVARVEESEQDMYAAIDVAAAKISRQLRKFKTRVQDKRKRKAERAASYEIADSHVATELDLDRLMDELADDEIVRRKKIEYKPLTEEEALIEIDLVGHDFFVYTDRDSGNVHVLYRRKDGSYGILTPDEGDEE